MNNFKRSNLKKDIYEEEILRIDYLVENSEIKYKIKKIANILGKIRI